MGYRMYLAKAKKGAKLTEETEIDGYFACNRNNIENLIELGKYVEWRKEDCPDLLNNGDTELYIVDKEFLLFIIEEYRKLNYEYHFEFADKIRYLADKFNKDENTTINLNDFSCIGDLRNYFNRKQREWSEGMSSNLRLEKSDDGNITSSWCYEYSIFNLVHLLHTFDWENDDLIYYGY